MKMIWVLLAGSLSLATTASAENTIWRGLVLHRSGPVQGCGSGRVVNVVEGNGKIMMKERLRYWTLPQNPDGSAAGEVEENSVLTGGKRFYRINVPPGSGPRVISMLLVRFACVYELVPG